jgi:large subunit ribosomal protein L37Ae
MAMRTPKYGATIRKLVDAAEKSKRTRYECPRCGKKKVARKSNALWKCRSCNAEFAGGAYALKTETGEIMLRLAKEYEKS